MHHRESQRIIPPSRPLKKCLQRTFAANIEAARRGISSAMVPRRVGRRRVPRESVPVELFACFPAQRATKRRTRIGVQDRAAFHTLPQSFEIPPATTLRPHPDDNAEQATGRRAGRFPDPHLRVFLKSRSSSYLCIPRTVSAFRTLIASSDSASSRRFGSGCPVAAISADN